MSSVINPRYPDFEQAEFAARHSKAQALMAERGLDAIVVTERLNYIYFSGHRSEQQPIDKIRPYIFILPAKGKGILISMEFERDQIRDTTWNQDVRFAGLRGRAAPVIEALKGLGLERGRIGLELGQDQYLNITHLELTEIMTSLSDASFVDASTIILKLRSVKSPAEIEYMRVAGKILAQAMQDTFQGAEAGITERKLASMLRTRVAELGGERLTFLWVVSSQDGMIAVPTDRKIEKGDMIVLDAGVEYCGYAADVSRTAFVGEPPRDVADFYGFMSRAVRESADALRPGNTASDVLDACQRICEERNLTAGVSGRIGHGVGLASTEFPSLDRSDPTIFEAGMVYACNPNFFYSNYGWMNNEDNWLIKPSGAPELLSVPGGSDELSIIE